MSVQDAIASAVIEFDRAVSHLKNEFSRLQVGRANPSLIENVNVDMYGAIQPLKAVANVSVPDPRTLQIQPWDKNALGPIEKGISNAGLGLNPVNDGNCVRISIPALTEERRLELTKHAKKLAEDARISVRNGRQDCHNRFKDMKANDELTEDDLHGGDKNLQDKVDEANKTIDEVLKVKEQDIMTV